MKICFVIPVLSQYEKCVKALESIVTDHSWEPIIMPQWRNKWPLSKAWNEGIKIAVNRGADYIFVINDDILFAPQTVDAIINGFSLTENVIMVTGCNKYSELAHDPELIKTYPIDPNPTWAESPDYSCFCVKPDFLDIQGLFDENFNPCFREDNDSHWRIHLLGYKAICTTSAPYFHYGSATQNADISNPIVPGPVFDAGGKYYEAKWFGPVGHEKTTHPYGDINLTPRDWRANVMTAERAFDPFN